VPLPRARGAILFLAALPLCQGALAQVSASASIVSDYRFRGVSLTDGRPAAQVDLAYDGASGWYAGSFLSNVKFDGESCCSVQALAYAGAATRLDAGPSIDAGASYSSFPGNDEVDYYEVHAGIATDGLSARLHFAPDYFGRGVHTLYAQLDGHLPLDQGFQLRGHVGDLHAVSGLPYARRGSHRNQADMRLGLAATVSRFSAEVAWVAVSRVSTAYTAGDYPVAPAQNRHAWLLRGSASF
jgi:uncharacterized protein (TIGR02001 family)